MSHESDSIAIEPPKRVDFRDRFRSPGLRRVIGGLTLATTLILSACDGSAKPSGSASNSNSYNPNISVNNGGPSATSSEASSASSSSPRVIRFTFDALGGGSPVIQVYPGVQNTGPDKVSDGTYTDGQTAAGDCITTGRTVTSDPSAGEEHRQSNEWVRLAKTYSDQPMYATETYVETSDLPALATLPTC